MKTINFFFATGKDALLVKTRAHVLHYCNLLGEFYIFFSKTFLPKHSQKLPHKMSNTFFKYY